MLTLILFLLLAIGVSFICSILEAVLLSVSDSYVAMLEADGKLYANQLRAMKTDIDKPLSTILTLNTIAHTVGAAGVGAQAQTVFGDAYLAIISAVLTFLILIFSEIIPKTLGARFWRKLIHPTVILLEFLMLVLKPIVWFCLKITGLLGKGDSGLSFTREELSAMADLGAKEGILEESEAMSLKSLVAFQSLVAKDVMTPRPVVKSLPKSVTIKEVFSTIEQSHYSRFPITGQNNEDIHGYVVKTDILLNAAQGKWHLRLDEISREILVVHDLSILQDVFNRLMERREHIALIVDEHGGMCGILTMEDIVETILGLEIMDESDKTDDLQALAKKQWLKRAQRNGLI
jgi:CBS domain containing-hemolysin-like protein